MNRSVQLGLGTVQFGCDYGITNSKGRVPEKTAQNILTAAISYGIDLVDTAAAYGECETVLGRILPGSKRIRLVTKPMALNSADVGDVLRSLDSSFSKLRVNSIYGVLVHRAADLLGTSGKVLVKELQEYQAAGRIEKFGVSVYSPDEVFEIFARYPCSIVQLPINALDQRMISSGAIDFLRKRDVEIHARSVFLQGLLVADHVPNGIPTELKNAVRDFQSIADKHGVSYLAAALGFVLAQKIDVAVCGVTSTEELHELVAASRVSAATELPWNRMVSDSRYLDPRTWGNKR